VSCTFRPRTKCIGQSQCSSCIFLRHTGGNHRVYPKKCNVLCSQCCRLDAPSQPCVDTSAQCRLENGEGPEAGALGAGAVGVGGCARLRWSAAGILSVSSDRLRCAWTLWAVSGRHLAPRPQGWRQRQARLLASLSPPVDRPRVPCLRRACRLQPAHLVAWRPLTAAADARETRQNSRRQWPSRLLSPLSPPADRPRVSSAYITIPYDRPAAMVCARHCGDAHTACCVRVWRLIAQPLGRDWVCM